MLNNKKLIIDKLITKIYNIFMEKEEIIEKILKLISKEMENPNLIEQFKNSPEELINTYFILCPVENINLEIVDLQNKLFALQENNYIEFEKCKHIIKTEESYYSLKIKSDYTLVFSNHLIEGIDIKSFDNFIILNGGMQLKQELAECFKQTGYVYSCKTPYIVNGYNLPCKKLCKILYLLDGDNKGIDVNNLVEAVSILCEKIKEGSKLIVDLTPFRNKDFQKIKKQIIETFKLKNKNKKIKIKFIL